MKGGISKLKLYTEEECDEILEREYKLALNAIKYLIKEEFIWNCSKITYRLQKIMKS